MYAQMQSTVDSICKSLREEPDAWAFSTYTFQRLGEYPQFWGNEGTPPTHIWTGGTREQVFSSEQARHIHEAYLYARAVRASSSQEKLQQAFLPAQETPKKGLLQRFLKCLGGK